MRPAVKDNEFKYWKCVLCYVDDLLTISHDPTRTIKSIQTKFKLKDDKMEEPKIYVGINICRTNNEYRNSY